jgi:hypothetical protein
MKFIKSVFENHLGKAMPYRGLTSSGAALQRQSETVSCKATFRGMIAALVLIISSQSVITTNASRIFCCVSHCVHRPLAAQKRYRMLIMIQKDFVAPADGSR